MADGYEVFDSGHNKLRSRHQRLTKIQVEEVMIALRALRLGSAEEARMMLLKGSGRRIHTVPELYDVELNRVLSYLESQKRKRR